MKQLVFVFFALFVAMVTATPIHRKTKLFQRALFTRLISSEDDCKMFFKLEAGLEWYFNGDLDLSNEQMAAFGILFPKYVDWLECYYNESAENSTSSQTQNESEEGTASEESAMSSTSSPTSTETEATSSAQEPETTVPSASRWFLLDKPLRDLQLTLKRRELLKHYKHKRR